MNIYLSGPMSGYPDFNRATFADAADWVTKTGNLPLNPGSIRLPETASWADYMRKALTLLMRADGMLLLPGWQESRGVQIEYALAKNLDIWMYEITELEGMIIALNRIATPRTTKKELK